MTANVPASPPARERPSLLRRMARGIPPMVWMRRLAKRGRQYMEFVFDYRRFSAASQASGGGLSLNWKDRRACLGEKGQLGFERHYLYHPAWAARILAKTRPERHADISSTVNFVAVVSAFVPIDYYEYRPVDLKLSNLTSQHADLLALPFKDGSIKSLSCMHTIEHVGLGRYGDPIDPDGDRKAAAELKRVVAPGGSLLVVVPVGRPRIVFNSERIYSYERIVEYFAPLTVKEYVLIPDSGDLIYGATPEITRQQSGGCGCFWFVRE